MAVEQPSSSAAPTIPMYTDKELDATIEEGALSGWNDTRQDEIDMQRLGKKQEFKRNFGFLSTLGFVSIYSQPFLTSILENH
jgi:choline transport protein